MDSLYTSGDVCQVKVVSLLGFFFYKLKIGRSSNGRASSALEIDNRRSAILPTHFEGIAAIRKQFEFWINADATDRDLSIRTRLYLLQNHKILQRWMQGFCLFLFSLAAGSELVGMLWERGTFVDQTLRNESLAAIYGGKNGQIDEVSSDTDFDVDALWI